MATVRPAATADEATASPQLNSPQPGTSGEYQPPPDIDSAYSVTDPTFAPSQNESEGENDQVFTSVSCSASISVSKETNEIAQQHQNLVVTSPPPAPTRLPELSPPTPVPLIKAKERKQSSPEPGQSDENSPQPGTSGESQPVRRLRACKPKRESCASTRLPELSPPTPVPLIKGKRKKQGSPDPGPSEENSPQPGTSGESQPPPDIYSHDSVMDPTR